MITYVGLLLALLLAMSGCTIGKGYVFESTGLTKCVVASAEEGKVSVTTPMNMYGSVTLEGKNVTYHSLRDDYCSAEDHTVKAE